MKNISSNNTSVNSEKQVFKHDEGNNLTNSTKTNSPDYNLYVKPYKIFYKKKDIYSMLKCCKTVYGCVPKILKNNIQFVVDMQNYTSSESDKKLKFYDDCGQWDYKSKNYVVTYHLKSDMSRIFYRNAAFFRKTRKGSVQEFIKLAVQPDKCNLIKIISYSLKHMLDKNYTRLVTAIFCKEFNRALFQYKGQQPKNFQRIRVDPLSIKTVTDNSNVKSKKIKNTVGDPGLKSKTIKNAKYRLNFKQKEFKGQNLANDVENVLKKLGDGFVQNVKLFKDPSSPKSHTNLPSVILFTEDQFVDMISCTADLNSVLSIDRTFNLGTCFLTAICFKNKKVKTRSSGSNPVFLGPCFLHKFAKEEDYNHFFSFLRLKICSMYKAFNFSKLSFITDGEQAMINSIYSCFPESSKLRCSIHIEKNIIFNLRKYKMAYSNKIALKRKLKRLMFSENLFKFADIKQDILKVTMDDSTARYVNNVMEEIFQFVSKPMWELKLVKPLTTNQSESMNHVIKNYVSWEKTNISELINNIKSIIKFQYDNLEFSISSQGDYLLQNSFSYHQFQSFKDAVKKKHFKELLKNSFRFIVSSSGNTRIPTSLQKTATKPGSRKRVKATRTITNKN